MEVKGQLHPRPFLPRRKSGHYPINRKPTQTPEPMTFRRIRTLARAGTRTTTPISQIPWPSHYTKAAKCVLLYPKQASWSSETQDNVNCSRTTESCMMQAGYCCWISTCMTRQCLARHWHGSWYTESNLINLLAAKNLSPSTWYLKTRRQKHTEL